MEWLVGSYSEIFIQLKKEGVPIRETVPTRAIMKAITLTSSMRIPKATIKNLKELYTSVEFV